MTICGGIIIGGDSSRNKRWPHKADLRRLSLRFSKARAEKTPKVSIVLEEESYYIKSHYDVDMSVRQCQRLFRNLGYSRIRPQPYPSKGNEDAEERNAFKKTEPR